MPEGHTIRRLADRHLELFGGQRVTAESPQGRFAAGAALISGTVLESTDAYGKHLLHRYSRDRTLHIHLGLYGKFTDGPDAAPPPVGEIRLRLITGDHWLDLRGPTACELLTPPEVKELIGRLGADPLRDDADPDAAYARIRRSAKPIGALLLDQAIVAGTGLIFVMETLFRAGLPPTMPGRSLSPEGWREIWSDLQVLMRAAVGVGRIDTVHAAHTPEAMGRPPRVDRHGGEVYVYRRAGQPCLVCDAPVRTAPLAGRNSYWCPTCQVL
ncbi:Fpg/Nei family DNA glycosylase [Planosporangium flavigriseum]|uniref:DNA-(apurinic or apyrimidinic site) lyase n=1 Tax=Planosporangium flavigriseum TaxID=373681 RepID=A0A8J3LS45_9ACTN|nr:Fpg/Nei family DNA glycosylase [Planosporangium flavigriseum]NJC63479.1 Fpg/Nei family DNA glycosylase [Planosporangium flavigriseum]GIG72175.1 endonuclease VIII [Planosporangium flavigriseum]